MKRATNQHTIRPSAFRVRGAVLAAGLGATVVLGAGTAFASSGSAAAAPLAASTTAESVAQQAASQAKAADAAKKTAAKKAAKKNAASWKAPVKKYKLTASYGTGGARWAAKHSGQDFAVPIGTPVSAVHTGTVVKAGPNGAGDGPAYGNAVVIKHSNGKYSQYAHLSKVNVKIGQQVKTGQKIALSGNTGNSSGPHLHFEIRTTPNYGSALNPAAFLRSVHVSI
ncbi:M23 family metallopeptidase [Streptomyces sp. S063]|uniref:M23 family metallopeptidase n=1 Tax=Streptomyces sp. S063 TaxID=2005885 RepID=UPI0010080E4E|nr:M23 family metallopeptidase [Streptomyces sp. S063]